MEWQYISSKSNPLVVKLSKLKEKKYRKAEGLFRFDGKKLFGEALSSDAPIEYVLLSERNADTFKNMIDGAGVDAKRFILSDDAFSKLTDEQAPEGIVTVCKNLLNISNETDCNKLAQQLFGKRVLILESVRDTGNMGTIIRSARAFGIDALAVSSDCADLYNSKTVRGAMGALFTQRIAVVENVADLVRALRSAGARVYAAALQSDARKLGSFELEMGDVIVIGNEGHGLSPDVIDVCDECLYIPMEQGSESLNAGIAASVCMWELYKIKTTGC